MNPSRASRTAERVAERRAAHQLLDAPLVFDDPLALRVVRAGVEDEGSPLSRYLRAFLAVRSRFAEDELRCAVEQGTSQYVILGAGFDTFAYRNPFPSLLVFEADHPATQQAKRDRLAEARIEVPESATYVAVDFAVSSLAGALRATRFDFSARTFFSWLGVVPYIEQPAIETTLQFVTSLPAGSAIVFDYGIPPESLSWLGRVAFRRLAARVAAAGEPWKTFFEPDDLLAMLRAIGFRAVEDLGPASLNARYLGGRADGLRVGEMGHIAKAIV